MDILEANKYAKAYAPHICVVNGEYVCYVSECGDAESGKNMEMFVIKMDAILTHREWEIQVS
jgi:hypothetical protein